MIRPLPLTLGLSVVLVAAVGLALAGPLNPPAGAIAPTGKTTQEIFDKAGTAEPRVAINATNTPGNGTAQFVITQPGSYYLTGDIMGVAGKSGIVIATNSVSIDLCGFGVLGTVTSLNGIAVSGTRNSIIIRNGFVIGWGGNGVDLGYSSGRGALVESVVATGNGGWGISGSKGSIIRNCTGSQNGQGGLSAGDGGLIESCTADLNTGIGIALGQGGTVRRSTFSSNTEFGVNGSAYCTVAECSGTANARGVQVYGGSVVSDCQIGASTLRGISVTADCVVRNNTCANTSANANSVGIVASGSDNRLEGNHCTGSGLYGLWVYGDHNVIVRNTCSGNGTNWSIGSNNFFGPIIDRTATAVSSMSGNSAAGSLGTTDTNANFSH